MEFIMRLKMEELVTWIASPEARNDCLMKVIPDSNVEEDQMEASFMSVLNESSTTWKDGNGDNGLSKIANRNAYNWIITRLEIPFTNPLLEQIRCNLRNSFKKYGNLNLIIAEPNKFNQRSRLRHLIKCPCGCNKTRKVHCSFPWKELMVLRTFKEYMKKSTNSSKRKKYVNKVRKSKKKTLLVRYRKAERITRNVSAAHIFEKARSDTVSCLQYMFQAQQKQVKKCLKKSKTRTRCRPHSQGHQVPNRSNKSCPTTLVSSGNPSSRQPPYPVNYSIQQKPQQLRYNQPQVAPVFVPRHSISTALPIPTTPRPCLLISEPPKIPLNPKGMRIEKYHEQIGTKLSREVEFEESAYELYPFEGESISFLEDPITAEEQDWLNNQLDLLDNLDKSEVDMEDLWNAFESFIAQTSQLYDLDPYLHKFEYNKLRGMATSLIEEQALDSHHGYAADVGTFGIDICIGPNCYCYQYQNQNCYYPIPPTQATLVSGNPYATTSCGPSYSYRDLYAQAPRQGPLTKSVEGKATSSYAQPTTSQYSGGSIPHKSKNQAPYAEKSFLQDAVEGLRNFQSDWPDSTEHGETEELNEELDTSCSINTPEPVCPPPGFTAEDRNKARNRILFEDYLVKCDQLKARNPVVSQHEPRLEISPQQKIADKDESLITTSEAEISNSNVGVFKRKHILNELQKPLLAESAWKKMACCIPDPKLKDIEHNNKNVDLPVDLDEFPTLDQAYGGERGCSKLDGRCNSSEKLYLPVSEILARRNPVGKDNKLPIVNITTEEATCDTEESTAKLVGEDICLSLFSSGLKSMTAFEDVGETKNGFQEVRTSPDYCKAASKVMKESTNLPSAVKLQVPNSKSLEANLSSVTSLIKQSMKIPSLMELNIKSPRPTGEKELPLKSNDIGKPTKSNSSSKVVVKSKCQTQYASVLVEKHEVLNDDIDGSIETELPVTKEVDELEETSTMTFGDCKIANELYSRMFDFEEAQDSPLSGPLLHIQPKKYVQAQQMNQLNRNLIVASNRAIDLKPICNIREINDELSELDSSNDSRDDNFASYNIIEID